MALGLASCGSRLSHAIRYVGDYTELKWSDVGRHECLAKYQQALGKGLEMMRPPDSLLIDHSNSSPAERHPCGRGLPV